ncbi:MAG: hypothetical protein LBM41_06195 [Ruminococcus sp.]|jgi:hypothetical protein|nr:hypothetical protein [Ruminococcus sp.]
MLEAEAREYFSIDDEDTFFNDPESVKSFLAHSHELDPAYLAQVFQKYPFVLEQSLHATKSIIETMMESDKESYKPIYESYQKIIDTCLEMAKDDAFDADMRMEFIKISQQIAKDQNEVNLSNKEHQINLTKTIFAGVAGLAALIVGGVAVKRFMK